MSGRPGMVPIFRNTIRSMGKNRKKGAKEKRKEEGGKPTNKAGPVLGRTFHVQEWAVPGARRKIRKAQLGGSGQYKNVNVESGTKTPPKPEGEATGR